MAYYSLHAYDADVFISGFTGLRQYGDGMNGNPGDAVEEQNAETPAGVLQPCAAPDVMEQQFQTRIETLMHLYRRWYTGAENPDVLFAATNGKLYYLTSVMSAWTQLAFPMGKTSYASNAWSWVSYEINPAGASSPVDVLLVSNAKDGMYIIKPPYTATVSNPDWKVDAVDTQGMKFGVIERYAERIWGGAMPEDPDTLAYSRPFDPTDWTAAGTGEEPEDGAGDIQQPSWDGDSFTALRAFGNQLIAFKRNRVWRILGTDPGEYTFKEQYGGGTGFPNTIAVDVERIHMADENGMEVYDGLSVEPAMREAIEVLWRTLNKSAVDQMCGALFQKRYYLAFPTGTSTTNNALIVWNMVDNTVLYHTGLSIESFMATPDTLYATSSDLPGKVLKIRYDSWVVGSATGAAVKWVSPWLDFGYKRIKKGGFDLYFQPEVKTTAVTLQFSVQTEKKIKSKKYTIQPLTNMEIAADKNYKQKRLHFGGAGRRFRVIIEADSGVTAPWRLIGGIQMVVETDPD